MPQPRFEEIIQRIHRLQGQLEQEFESLFKEKQKQFNYTLEKGKVIFEQGIAEIQKHYRTGIWDYLRHARLRHILTAPVIYSVAIPLLLIDVTVTLYQQICFRVYGITLVKRRDYFVFDRHHLAYLNIIEKINCLYCGYGNGLIEYVREVIARTEQYWCPIKHARRVKNEHARTEQFADYGDAKAYQKKLDQLRNELRKEQHDRS